MLSRAHSHLAPPHAPQTITWSANGKIARAKRSTRGGNAKNSSFNFNVHFWRHKPHTYRNPPHSPVSARLSHHSSFSAFPEWEREKTDVAKSTRERERGRRVMAAQLTSWSLLRFLKLRKRLLFSLVGVEGIAVGRIGWRVANELREGDERWRELSIAVGSASSAISAERKSSNVIGRFKLCFIRMRIPTNTCQLKLCAPSARLGPGPVGRPDRPRARGPV